MSALALALASAGCGAEPVTEDDADPSADSGEGAAGEARSALVTWESIALGKPTSQSSTGWEGASSRAVDGNLSGSWGDNSVTHTLEEAQPWWQVDLGSVQPVGEVLIHNRTDCCGDRLSDFTLLVSDDGATWQSYEHPGAAGQITRLAVDRTARYVKVQLNGTNALSLAEVQVFHPRPNLAVGKPASQSTTTHDALASRAVDGNTSGTWLDGSVTHTATEWQSWWQVDLLSSESIGDVVLYNRTDCCGDRLSNFTVLVSSDGTSWQSYAHPGAAGAKVTIPVNRAGRYVKVRLNGINILSLAEVQVFHAPENLAAGKPASQSTVAYSGAASRAVDGNTSGSWSDASVTHTITEPQPWWQVDLLAPQPIGDVVLHNRTDCCAERLSNFSVLVSDDGASWQSYSHAGVAGAQVKIPVNRSGRYVKVQLDGTGILSLAEVQVLAGSCAPEQVLLDGATCVTLTPWPTHTDLPAGSQVAVRLRRVMIDYYGGSVVWPKWVGVSASDNQTIDAVDTELTSRNLFTVTTFRPAGEVYYDLPWYNMQASNGMYVGPSSGDLVANLDLASAWTFARGSESWNGEDFLILGSPWSEREARLAQIKQYGNHYAICQSPFTLGMPSIIGWYSGPAPNYGCYVSGEVDYFVVN